MKKKNLIISTNHYNLDSSGKLEHLVNFEPAKELIGLIYDYIKKMFSEEIGGAYLHFYQDFSEKIYGLDYSSQKTIALKDFKSFYNEVKVLKGEMFHRTTSSSGIKNVKPINRFLFLKEKQNAIKEGISGLENEYFLEYLIGNEEYFEKENLINRPGIKELIEFESILNILLNLNDQFKFEEDFEFSNFGLQKEIFEKYKHIFRSFEVFGYAHKKIKSFRKLVPSQIESLYDA